MLLYKSGNLKKKNNLLLMTCLKQKFIFNLFTLLFKSIFHGRKRKISFFKESFSFFFFLHYVVETYFNKVSISFSKDSGEVVEAYLLTTLPSLLMINFSKFHLILFKPNRPDFWDFKYL